MRAHAEPRKTVRENHRSNLANLMARFCFQFLNPKNLNPKKKGLGNFFFALDKLYKTFLKSIYKFYILFIFFCLFVLNN